MSSVVLDTDDLGEAEELVSATYARMKFGSLSDHAPTRTQMVRSVFGSAMSDRVHLSYHLGYEFAPSDAVLLIRVHSGTYHAQQPFDAPAFAGRGEALALGARADMPAFGGVDQATFTCVPVGRGFFSQVAANAPADEGPVRLTGQGVVSRAANRHLIGVIDHVCTTMANHEGIAPSPLVVGGMQRYLASVMLNVFPSSALLEPTAQDRCGNAPVLLRRATVFIDENAHRDISLSDIAAAVYISPRAVQYMFRRHLDCTPTDYIRKTRLSYAHDDLIGGNRLTTSVATIARKWGFSNPGRFAAAYRRTYGQSPHITLQA